MEKKNFFSSTGSVSTMTTTLTSDSKSLHGVSTAEHREIHALITFKGGFICSLGSGYDSMKLLQLVIGIQKLQVCSTA